jgi:hypothetical protein
MKQYFSRNSVAGQHIAELYSCRPILTEPNPILYRYSLIALTASVVF